ncbi:flagellar biosynthesis protein FliR [Methylocapsa polymorpha]|uniref:Flagellar biosynthetic protein FliR n=1 Tax=Methylocapsa polymorpha TaxID=3080828 RepID=A0ABZ0HMY2_9HYPH|nr:flagellar biosynthesis protein FliR [Methylocapsa sp. RX1]
MTAVGTNAVLAAFVMFCRIGACLMLMPGVSSPRIPANVRLFIAFAVTLALTPLFSGVIEKRLIGAAPTALILILFTELVIGALIGFLGRIFFGALETLGSAIATAIGLASPLATSIDEAEPLPAVATLLTLGATMLFFLTDLHWEVLRGLIDSYAAIPVSGEFNAQFALVQVSDCLSKSFFLALRISSPFIVYSLIVNLAVGLAAKLTPQIPIYFITAPGVIAGGLFLLYATCKQFLELFTAGFSAWLSTG